MIYKLIITKEMDRLLDKNIYYLIYKLKSKQSAKHFLDSVEKGYSNITKNPRMYRESEDLVLKSLHYHEAKLPDMNYIIIYKIVESTIYVLGIFHCLEDYNKKVI
jgi:plasmid stabilization system protein ParE